MHATVFVFSRRTAPPKLVSFQRLGPDLFIVVDPDNAAGDVVVDCAVAVACALSARRAQTGAQAAADLEDLDRAILDIERRAENLGDIHESATTIRRGADEILKRADLDRADLGTRIGDLRNGGVALRLFVLGRTRDVDVPRQRRIEN